MPYFHNTVKNEKVNLLLIHIPKTGGTSSEQYFSKKYNVPLNKHALFSSAITNNGASLQHQTYNDIIENPSKFNVDYTNLVVLAAVRNPYSRLISDLWFYKLIELNATPEQVYQAIKNKFLVATNTFDNHNLPQHTFITGRDGALIPDLIIIKQESLTDDMKSLGYSDFNIHVSSSRSRRKFMDLLNPASIALINSWYEKDFSLLGYSMVT